MPVTINWHFMVTGTGLYRLSNTKIKEKDKVLVKGKGIEIFNSIY